jgi:glycosyltransferase involved in cell wall biosynthesis
MFGRGVDVLPIAVDGDLWSPSPRKKKTLRDKYDLPQDRKIGVWCGTSHPMKGFQNLIPYAQANPDIFWVIIWKTKGEQADCPFEGKALVHAPQDMMADIYRCADFFAVTGLLDPYFMCEYEAMACNLPLLDITNRTKEFFPEEGKSRQALKNRGWLREQAKDQWLAYIKELSEEP